MGIVLGKYKAIYFYIPKVASTTLLTSFSQIAYGRQIPIRQMPTVKENQMDKRYKDYYKFSFVRNPFDRIVSCFQDKVLKGGLDFGSDVKSFGDFASKVCLIPDQDSNMHFKSQHRFLTGGHNDALWTDYIGRFENLDRDYQSVCAHIGVKNPPSLKRRNVSVRNNYKNYYDEKTYNLIKKRYLKDLTLFGYKF